MPKMHRFQEWWKRLARAHPVLSNIGILATGTAAGQAVAIIISVFTARLFSAQAFGEFALFTSITGIFAVIATLRYDVAIVLPDDDDDARQLARLATRSNIAVSLVACVLAFACKPLVIDMWGSRALATWLPLVGLTVFCTAQVAIWQYWYNRKREYGIIALNRFETVTGSTGGQLLFGLAKMQSFLGLVLGNLVGLVWAFFNLGRHTSQLREAPSSQAHTITDVARRYKNMPLLNLPNALVDAVRTNGIQMLIGTIALDSLGQFNLAWRVVQAPIALLNGAIAQVFLERLARTPRGHLQHLVRMVIKRAFLIGLAPFFVLWLLAPWLLPFVFGHQWVEAGQITRALVPWLAVNLITSPIASVFVVTFKQHWILIHAIIFTVIPLAWLALSPLSLLPTIQVLSFLMAGMLLVLVVLADFAAKSYDRGAAEAEA
ncbi:MAG: lipopolysaccharide biosynthesis protein [Actinomycetaceae bacterium]|nr:lipopolysaccharide biosynthesis protein [Actinomycetaceae bacterium]MDY6082336.1 lipopolysaccharide biosynthesis protein [Actinomycetaceae bacterium]